MKDVLLNQKEAAAMSETRNAYVETMKVKIDEWNVEIDKLQTKADQARADIQVECKKQVSELKDKRQDLYRRMSELKKSSETAWEDMKSGLDTAWQAMGESVKSAQSRFENK
jgi:FtsZ-binding cell division protein ZapB